jgi:CHAT domain-containing protein/tetratricopeptide (TPR) repeat protein
MYPDNNAILLDEKANRALENNSVQEAVFYYTQAIKEAQNLGRPRLMVALLSRLGQALYTHGQIQKALSAFEGGLQLLDNEPGAAKVLVELGRIEKTYQESTLAMPDLYTASTNQSLEETENDPGLVARMMIRAGNAYLQMPQAAAAIKDYQAAMQEARLIRVPHLEAEAQANYGMALYRQGNLEAAQETLEEAIQQFERLGELLEKRRALAMLATVLNDQGFGDRALELFQLALSLYDKAGDQLGDRRTLTWLGIIYLKRSEFALARQAFNQAYHPREEDDAIRWQVLWGLGVCNQQEGNLEQAAHNFEESLRFIENRQNELRTDQGKVSFLESVREAYDRLIQVYMRHAKRNPAVYVRALEIAERARAQSLNDILTYRRHNQSRSQDRITPSPQPEASSGSQPMTMSATSSFDALSLPMNMAPGFPVVPLANQMVQAAPSYAIPDSTAGKNLAQEDMDATAVGPNKPQRRKRPLLPRLVYHVMEKETAIFSVSHLGRVRGAVIGFGRAELNLTITRLRRALGVNKDLRGVEVKRNIGNDIEPDEPEDADGLLRDLYSCLIAPVKLYLPKGKVTLAIEAHEDLWALPFAALRSESGSYLGDRFPLVYAPSENILSTLRQEQRRDSLKKRKALIIGNPEMPAVPEKEGVKIILLPLSGAEAEAQQIQTMLGIKRSTLLLGEEADIDHVLELMKTAGLIHFATHGIAYPNAPLDSFIALGKTREKDGLLSARDVMNIGLPADLVVLSACQTALGKVLGEGMIGLGRAFLAAGVRTVIVSQWSVSDNAISKLMGSFYRKYLGGKNKACALQEAMLELRDQYPNPQYWAPFIVFGAEN